MKLDGFGLFVKDIDKMVCFYSKVLGFEIQYEEGDNHVYLHKDGVLFMMYTRKEFEQMTAKKYTYPKGINGTFEMAFSVKDYHAVDDTFADVVAKGAQPVMEPTTEPWGQRTCYIQDPEGNLIEIGSFNVGNYKEAE